MGCKKRTIQYARFAGKLLGAVVVNRLTDTVNVLDRAPDGWLTNSDKRRLVIEDAKAAWTEEWGQNADEAGGTLEGAIRTALETALWNLRQGIDAIEIKDQSDAGDNLDV